MAKYAVLGNFYASSSWNKFRALIISERGLICEHCGKIVAKSNELTLHHVKELTPENVSDTNVSLNPHNVMVVHRACHDQIHHRFGYQVGKSGKSVYIIFGPPMSGKTSYAREHMQRGDIVVDMDMLYAAVSLLPDYDKPDVLLGNVMGLRNLLIDNIKTRYGKWVTAYVIGGYADRYKREKMAEDLGAELIFCDVSKDECLSRLELDEDRRYRKDEWRGYINKWFERYAI